VYLQKYVIKLNFKITTVDKMSLKFPFLKAQVPFPKLCGTPLRTNDLLLEWSSKVFSAGLILWYVPTLGAQTTGDVSA
jgi:hypothetical protein